MPFPNPDTKFKPGRSGNPAGRPKGAWVTRRLRELLEQVQVNGVTLKYGKTPEDELAHIILIKAVDGDYRFIDLVMNRIEGKIPNTITIDTHDTTAFVRDFLLVGEPAEDAAGPVG